MASLRVVKGSVGFLLKELSTYRQIGCSYTSWGFRVDEVVEARELGKSPFSSNPTSLRRFSFEVSASEQMDLIKQLRERTSAPIKDVKSSLVSCNWDIGGCMCLPPLIVPTYWCLHLCIAYLWINAEAAQKDPRKRGMVLASKKSLRTATEGLLALAPTENKAVVDELNCETDFVARNDIFGTWSVLCLTLL